MGCEGLLARPWNVQSEDMLREFLFLRGNQWDETTRRDPGNWTPNSWCEVYGFKMGIKEGWVGWKDGLFAGKFTEEVDPKEGLHPGKCKNPRERRMLEFMMPILNSEKPKRITLTVTNTLFGALSGVQPVNWVLIIHDIVERGLSLIGRKPSYLFPSIMHLYACFGCTTVDEDDMLISVEDEITYQLQPMADDGGTKSDHPIPDATPSPPGSPAETSRRAGSPPPPSPHHPSHSPRCPPPGQHDAGPSRTQAEASWQNVDLSTWTFSEDHSHPREIHTIHEWSVRGYPKVGSARRNSEAGTVSGSTRISDWDPVQGSRRGGGRAQSANGRGARERIQTKEYKKNAGEDPLFSTEAEEYQVREVRTGSVTCPPDSRLISHTG